jgi:hypothetical protein
VLTDYPIVKQFVRKCPPATKTNTNPHRAFETGVVTCDLDAASLPLVMNSSTFSLSVPSYTLTKLSRMSYPLRNLIRPLLHPPDPLQTQKPALVAIRREIPPYRICHQSNPRPRRHRIRALVWRSEDLGG